MAGIRIVKQKNEAREHVVATQIVQLGCWVTSVSQCKRAPLCNDAQNSQIEAEDSQQLLGPKLSQ